MLHRNLRKLGQLWRQSCSMDAPDERSYKAAPREGGRSADMAVTTKEYRPKDDEPFMNERQREYFRAKLLAWKEEILEESRGTIATLQQETVAEADLADRATSETDRGLELRTRDRQRKLIAKIDQALRRIDGVLEDPQPSTLVLEFLPDRLTLQFLGWVDQRTHSVPRVRSEGMRTVKSALEKAGVHRAGTLAPPQPEPVAERVAPEQAMHVDTSKDVEIDEQLAAQARAMNVPVNVVDRADLSTFIFPSIVDRGDVVVAIGTGGTSPVLARRLRERIEQILPERIGEFAGLMGRYRDRLHALRHRGFSTRQFWERVIDFEALAEEGVISADDLKLFSYCESAEEAWESVCRHYAGTPDGVDC